MAVEASTGGFWVVNSYGYPNPFVIGSNAQGAWEKLLSFYDFASYSRLKDYWGDARRQRPLTSNAVESWKATFEEFGLLYVLAGTDEIHITPAGLQLREAAEAGREEDFAWIGVSLLLRYPLRGPRGQRIGQHLRSDLLPYWFLYAAMRELQDYFWWTEFERVLAQVFRVDQAESAVADVRRLRSDQAQPERFPLPVSQRRGAFYNSLNQVVVHAGLNYLLLGRTTDDSLYEPGRPERRHWIQPRWLPIVDRALGGLSAPDDCQVGAGFLARMPRSPDFGDEASYFEYAGAPIPSVSAYAAGATPKQVAFEGGTVVILKEGIHYTAPSVAGSTEIRGPAATLCKLARGQRLVLGHDLARSYIVEDKQRSGADAVVVRVRRARPISDPSPFWPLLGTDDD